MRIRSIGVFSAGAMMGAVYAMFGLLAGAFVSLLSTLGVMVNRGGGGDVAALLLGAGAIVAMPLFYGILGFIGGILSALIYNVAAMFVGGLEVSVDGGHQAFTME